MYRDQREKYLITYEEANTDTPPFTDLFQGEVSFFILSSLVLGRRLPIYHIGQTCWCLTAGVKRMECTGHDSCMINCWEPFLAEEY